MKLSSEIGYALVFILIVIVGVSSFLFGIKIGKEETEATYEQIITEMTATPDPGGIYTQQDISSFYNSVYVPYLEIQKEWLAARNALALGKLSEAKRLFDELSTHTNENYAVAKQVSMSESAPLLQDAQIGLLKGMKLIGETSHRATLWFAEGTSKTITYTINQDQYYLEAVKQITNAKYNYHFAILKWASKEDSHINGKDTKAATISIAQWSPLPVVIKNKIMSQQMRDRKLIANYEAQDLTAAADRIIASGISKKMGAKTVNEVIDLLLSTEAVRKGDFLKEAEELYKNQTLPKIPLFGT